MGGRSAAIVTGVLGIAAGFVAGWAVGSGGAVETGAAGTPPPRAAPGEPATRSAADSSPVPASQGPPSREAVPATAPAPGGGSRSPFHDLDPGEAAFLAAALSAERERRAATRFSPEDSGIKVLSAYRAGADVESLAWSFEKMARHVRVEGRTVSVAPTADGSPIALKDIVGDANIIEFGPGRFQLAHDGFSYLREGNRSLEIRGAGMDRTTLVTAPGANDILHLWKGATLENLVVRDLTVAMGTQGGLLLDVNGEASALLERVRFRGWEAAGHAAPLGVSGSAFLALRDCEFMGEGRRVVGISCRGPALVLLEGCLFSNMEGAVRVSLREGPGGHVHILGGTFENTPLSDRPPGDPRGALSHLSVRGSQVRLGASGLAEEQRSTAWGRAFADEVTEVTFGPGTPYRTLDSVLGALARVESTGDELVTLVEDGPSAADGTPTWRVRLHEKSTAKVRSVAVPLAAGGAVTAIRDRGGGWALPEGVPLDTLLDLSVAVRKAGIPGDTSIDRAGLGGQGSGETATAVWYVFGEKGWPEWILDAKTGEIRQTQVSR